MAELTTKTAAQVATEVKRLFGDEDGVQISTADIINWINSAQRKIVSVNPILQMSVAHDVIAGQAIYTFPADRIQYIQSLSFEGVTLTGYSYTEAQEYIGKTDNADTTGAVPLIWWQWAQAIHLWPAPTVSSINTLTMDFVATPVTITVLTDVLSVPDRYFDAVVEHVMTKAHLLDENWDAANFSKGMFGESLAQLSEQENRVRIATYPNITVRAEDW